MNANLKQLRIFEDTCSRKNETERPKEAAINFKNQVTECLDTVRLLSNIEPKELSTQELLDVLRRAYNISLTEGDYLKMLSTQNGKRYTKTVDIKTTITHKDVVSKGHGKEFSWWPVTSQVVYHAASIDELKFSKDNDYTKEEVKRLLNKKDIVILSQSLQELTTEPTFKKELYEVLPQIGVKFDPSQENMSDFVNGHLFLLDTILKSKFTKRKILGDTKTYLIALNYDIDLVLRSRFENVKKECKKVYNQSQEQEDILTLTKSFASIRPE